LSNSVIVGPSHLFGAALAQGAARRKGRLGQETGFGRKPRHPNPGGGGRRQRAPDRPRSAGVVVVVVVRVMAMARLLAGGCEQVTNSAKDG
jgi:hypothetical protein